MARVASWLLALSLALVIGIGTASAAKKDGGAAKPKKTPEEVFKAKDKDGDGKLSADEFVGKAKPEQADKLKAEFKKKDTNNDGFLSLEEFTAKPAHKGKKNK